MLRFLALLFSAAALPAQTLPAIYHIPRSVLSQISNFTTGGASSGGTGGTAITAPINCSASGFGGIAANTAIVGVVSCSITSPPTTCPNSAGPASVSDSIGGSGVHYTQIASPGNSGTTRAALYTHAITGSSSISFEATVCDYCGIVAVCFHQTPGPSVVGQSNNTNGTYPLAIPKTTANLGGGYSFVIASSEAAGPPAMAFPYSLLDSIALNPGNNYGAYLFFRVMSTPPTAQAPSVTSTGTNTGAAQIGLVQ